MAEGNHTIGQLLRAAAENDVATVGRLVRGDPSLANARGPHPYWGGQLTPLAAVEWCNAGAATELLDAGADPNNRGEGYGGWPVLLVAIARGRLRDCPQIAALLIARGAHVDLTAAAALGMIERAAALLEEDPGQVHRRGPGGTTALHWADTVGVAHLLLERGAGHPSRYGAGRCRARRATAEGRSGARRPADISLGQCCEFQRRDAAAHRGDPRPGGRRQVLLEHGADVRAGCLNDVQPLHYTAWKGAIAIARLLLDHGADINAVDASVKATPLAWAQFQRRPRLVALLQERGARR